MTRRPFNFSAGPATLPEEVLSQAAQEMLDWRGSGMSVMEMSHRGKEFISIYEEAERDIRTLLAVPDEFSILFMQGGANAENAILPLNLSRGEQTDYVVTGNWSERSQKEARKYCSVNIAASNAADGHTHLPGPGRWQLSKDARYVHVCTNETVYGIEMHELPDL
jgi:phosphoserine aminotransferase